MTRLVSILAVLALALPVAARAAASYVQGFSNHGASPYSFSFSANVTAGDFLVLVAAPSNSTASLYTVGVTDNLGETWTAEGTPCLYNYTAQANVFYVPSATGGATTITITSSTATTIYAIALEYSGLNSSATPFDVAPSCNQEYNATTFTTPSITTTNANDAVLAFEAGIGTPGAVTVAAPFTVRAPGSNQPAAADDFVSSTGSYQATFTNQYGISGLAVIMAVKQAGAAPTYHPPGHAFTLTGRTP